MPCYDERTHEDWLEEKLKDLQVDINVLTRMLCSTLSVLERADDDLYVEVLGGDPYLREWYLKHKEFDNKRKAETAEVEAAIVQKTEELKVLNARLRKIK